MSNENVAPIEDSEETQEDSGKEETAESEELNLQHMEQIEEAKLKAKYPAAKKPGGTTFLQKRLNRGQKYFDSGDYNMAKATGQKRSIPVVPQPTGEAIPTPDNLPTRKTSLVQSKLAAGLT